jgi:phage baseplate assembly protein W
VSRILSHPFRIAGNGSIATVEQTSDQANAEQVAILILTEIGERPLVPGFGVVDPAFSTLDPAELAAGLTAYGPDVRVTDVRIKPESDSTQLVEVDFE